MAKPKYANPEPSRELVSGESPLQLAQRVRALLRDSKSQTRARRRVWDRWSNIMFVGQLAAGAAATVLIGVTATGWVGALAVALSATATALTAASSWFAFRPRAEAADRALAVWHRLEDQLEMYVASRSPEKLNPGELLKLDAERQEAWEHYSATWLSARASSSTRHE